MSRREVIQQHYYITVCFRCGWEGPHRMTESSAEKDGDRHELTEHGDPKTGVIGSADR